MFVYLDLVYLLLLVSVGVVAVVLRVFAVCVVGCFGGVLSVCVDCWLTVLRLCFLSVIVFCLLLRGSLGGLIVCGWLFCVCLLLLLFVLVVVVCVVCVVG